MKHLRMAPLVVAASVAVSGCVTTVPSMGQVGEKPQARELHEADLVNHIKCEIHLAFQRLGDEAASNNGPLSGNSIDWLQTWGTKVNLQIQVDDKSTLSPAISVTEPLQNAVSVFPENGNVTIARNRGAGATATLASEITRTETIGYLYKIADLAKEGRLGQPSPDGKSVTPTDPSFCGPIDLVSNNDLQFYDFLHSKAMLAVRPDALPQKVNGAPFDVLQFEVKFIVTKAGSLNPSFKLVRLSLGQSGTLWAGQRVKTNDLTITLGPVETKDGKTAASASLDDQHLATLIGRAVADAIQQQGR